VANPFLSIIFPAHNEEHRLPATLESTAVFLESQPFTSEILVVENGSSDRTVEVASAYIDRIKNLRVLQEPMRGKGTAVKRGMLEAHGDFRIFCDVDLSMPVSEVVRFIPPQLPGVDVAIASREAEGAVRYDEPSYRHVIGRIFNNMVRWTLLPGLHDTQCGFKCFSAAATRAVFQYQTIPGMTFDVELLYIARLHGFKIVEVPIPWYFNPDSRVRLFEDSLRMAVDLIAIKRNAHRGLYGTGKKP
jgi:glycosyltransferase involved in cell wall biosynthesis